MDMHPDRRTLISALSAAAAAPLLLPGAARAQGTPPAGGTVTVTEAPVVSLQTWLDTWGRPTARVMLNGQGPFRFMVDTGSNTTVVSRAAADRLALTVGAPATVHGVTGSISAPLTRLGLVEIGNTRTENLRAVVFDGPAFSQADGILGMDMFASRRVRFSFRRREVDLEQGATLSRLNLPIRASMRLRNGLLPELDGTIGGQRARFVLDTGAEISLINQPLLTRLMSRRRRFHLGTETAVIQGATRQVLNGQWVSLPTVDFMGLKTTNLTVAAADAPIFSIWDLQDTPTMLVGMDVLSSLDTLVIDYRRRQVHLRLLAALNIGDTAGQATG
jgi:predicted aspartyl protease